MPTDHEQLAAKVRTLYSRLHSNTLLPVDTIDVAEATFQDPSAYVSLIYKSLKEFDKSFSAFKVPYDIFRAFPADRIVLDVGAHWGYSVMAMRHQGCKSRIFSVEAMQSNAAALNMIKSLDKGKYDWFNVAAGAEEGTLKFFIPMLNGVPVTGLSSTGSTLDDFFADHLAGLAESYPPEIKANEPPAHVIKLIINKVRATRIDALLRANGDLQNDVVAVKMDVEGHESFALKGAEKLFTEQKPMLMLEEANRNDRVTAVMMGYGYFHCERHDGKMVPHLAYSRANDGYWVHPDHVESYRQLGIFEGKLPTAAEMAVPPVSDGVARKGPAGQS
jgi:FkbM family methyltransferase